MGECEGGGRADGEADVGEERAEVECCVPSGECAMLSWCVLAASAMASREKGHSGGGRAEAANRLRESGEADSEPTSTPSSGCLLDTPGSSESAALMPRAGCMRECTALR